MIEADLGPVKNFATLSLDRSRHGHSGAGGACCGRSRDHRAPRRAAQARPCWRHPGDRADGSCRCHFDAVACRVHRHVPRHQGRGDRNGAVPRPWARGGRHCYSGRPTASRARHIGAQAGSLPMGAILQPDLRPKVRCTRMRRRPQRRSSSDWRGRRVVDSRSTHLAGQGCSAGDDSHCMQHDFQYAGCDQGRSRCWGFCPASSEVCKMTSSSVSRCRISITVGTALRGKS
jgi:hypothetical protein